MSDIHLRNLCRVFEDEVQFSNKNIVLSYKEESDRTGRSDCGKLDRAEEIFCNLFLSNLLEIKKNTLTAAGGPVWMYRLRDNVDYTMLSPLEKKSAKLMKNWISFGSFSWMFYRKLRRKTYKTDESEPSVDTDADKEVIESIIKQAEEEEPIRGCQ